MEITVNPQGNLLPTVDAAADPASGNPPLTVGLRGRRRSTPTVPRTGSATEWDFGDGTGGQFGRKVSHTYRAAGSYTAKVTATDERGGTATKTLADHDRGPARQPVADGRARWPTRRPGRHRSGCG